MILLYFTPDQRPWLHLQPERGWAAPPRPAPAFSLTALLDPVEALEPGIATPPPLDRLWAGELCQALEEGIYGG